MSGRLAFVDDPTRLSEVPSGFDVVALDPFVELAAPDAIPLDRHLDDLELERLGEETLERTLSLCTAIDDASALGPLTARWRFQELKTHLDGLLVRTLGATRIVEGGAVDEALLLIAADTLDSEALVPALAGAGIATRIVSAPRGYDHPSVRPGGALSAARTRARRALRRRRPRILCLDEQYNVPAVVEALRERGADPMLWLPPRHKQPHLRGNDLRRLAPLFRIAGVDLWPAAQTALSRLWEEQLPRDAAAFAAATNAIRRDRPDALLASTYAAPAAKAAATAARFAGIPTLVTRHGELGTRDLPVMRFNDLDVVEWALCWGTWEAEFVARHALRPVQTVVVGAPMIETAARAAPPREEIRAELGVDERDSVALFVPTSMTAESWFAGRSVPFDLSHARHQIAVVEQLLADGRFRVMVKEHTADEGPLQFWASRTGASVTFVRGRSYSDLIHLADVTVLDFPSTTLAQALAGTSRVVVVRHPVTTWEPGVVDHLEQHGVPLVSVAGLAAELRRGEAAPRPHDALEPLVASGAGTAADRAADAVLEVATRSRP